MVKIQVWTGRLLCPKHEADCTLKCAVTVCYSEVVHRQFAAPSLRLLSVTNRWHIFPGGLNLFCLPTYCDSTHLRMSSLYRRAWTQPPGGISGDFPQVWGNTNIGSQCGTRINRESFRHLLCITAPSATSRATAFMHYLLLFVHVCVCVCWFHFSMHNSGEWPCECRTKN